ncbi:MAG: hypothetical protein ACRD4S_14225 [Candidatus Acidiferrales bacterium]
MPGCSFSVIRRACPATLFLGCTFALATFFLGAPEAISQHVPPGETAADAHKAGAGKQISTNHFKYTPITARQRFAWFVNSTVGVRSLVDGVLSSAFETGIDRPKEYGPHWDGFGDRYGMRLTGISTGNAAEATVGALWGEDPRYFRVPDESFGARVRNVVMRTFTAYRRDGHTGPAYARFIAISGNNFLSNTWRVHSEANVHDAVLRIGLGFSGTMASNAFGEFWPDVARRVFHRHSK